MEIYQRLLNVESVPNIDQMKQTIGKEVLLFCDNIWNYIRDAYEIDPELIFYGKKSLN